MPTLSHSLGPLSREVVRALHLDRAGLEFKMTEPTLTTLGRGGASIVFHRDPVLTAGSINRLASSDAVRWSEFLKFTQRVGSLVARISHQAPPPIDEISTRDWLRLLRLGRSARALGRRDLARVTRWVSMPVADLAAEWFEHDLMRAALSAHAIFGNPVGPMSGGTGGMLLQRLGLDPHPLGSGATVRGGPGALTAALVRDRGETRRHDSHRGARGPNPEPWRPGEGRRPRQRRRAAGGRCRLGHRSETHLHRARGSGRAAFDVPERIRCLRARGVTAKINLALSGPPVLSELEGDPVPLRGRLLIAPDVMYLERAYDATKYGEMSQDPWLEVSVPTMTDSSLSGIGHVMSIYVHFAPRHLRNGTWAEKKEALYRAALRVLAPHMPSLASLIVEREILTPEDLETHWGLSGGHIFHGELALDQTWIGRPLLGWSQDRTPIDRLFLAGAGAHPGGGLTGLPGLLAAKTVDRLMRQRGD